MFCSKCGSSMSEESSFCAKCGVSTKNTQPHPVNANYLPSSQINNSNDQKVNPFFGFLKRRWKIITPLVVAAIAGAVVLFVFMSNYSSLIDLQTAFNYLDAEITERMEATPLMAVSTFTDTIDNGTTSVFFEHVSSWRMATRGNITLIADGNNREYALLGSVTLPFIPIIDFEAYINRDRMAFGSRMLPGSDLYGINFRTFRNDLQRISGIFADLIDMNILADYVESIEQVMHVDTVTLEDLLEPYSDLLISFIRSANHTSGREYLTIGGEEVRSNVITLTFTEEHIISLLRDFYNILAQDSNLRAQFELSESPFMLGMSPGISHSEFLREFRQAINSLEQDLSGKMTWSFYLNGNNRMLRANIIVDMEYAQEAVFADIVADFGLNSQGTWRFTVSTGIGNNLETASLYWVFDQNGANSYMHSISFVLDQGAGQGFVNRFMLDWDSNSGDFTLSHLSTDTDTSISGRFITNNDGRSRLRLDNLPVGNNEFLTLDINMSPEVDIQAIEFVDISNMTLELINDIFAYVFAIFVGMTLF